jgi:small subunit ribosomal protein S20
LSSRKALRRSARRAERNKSRRTQLKNVLRKFSETAGAKNVTEAEKAFVEVVRLVSRNADRRTIHPNTAARRKSRMARRLNALKAGTKTSA